MKLMRKFSFRRHSRQPQQQIVEEPDCNGNSNIGIRPCASWRSMRSAASTASMMHCEESSLVSSAPPLPTNVMKRIVDQCSVREQVKMRTVSRQLKQHVDAKFAKLTHMDVHKDELEKYVNLPGWQHLHAQIAVKIEGNTVQLVVDSRWTARDAIALVGAMSIFRRNLQSVAVDAPIAELIVVSLSVLSLQRWYAFQCYMKALDAFDADVHLQCEETHTSEVYWPIVSEITVRTSPAQANHLARLLDYGVRCSAVFTRTNIRAFRLLLVDSHNTSNSLAQKLLARHLYNFRCWAGSVGFDERFEQRCLSSATLTVTAAASTSAALHTTPLPLSATTVGSASSPTVAVTSPRKANAAAIC